jgi:hypothetical protein
VIGGDGGTSGPGGDGGFSGDVRGGNVYTNLTMQLSNATLNAGVATAGSGGAGGGNAGGVLPARGGNVAAVTVVDGTVTSSIIANGTATLNPDLDGTLIACATLVENLGTGVLTPAGGANCANLTGVDPQLGALGANGGPTSTHALLPASPARDVGDNPLALASDQRQPPYPRVSGPRADMGAFELPAAQVPTVTVTVAPASVPELGPGDLVYTFIRSDSQTIPLGAPLTVCFTITGSATITVDYTGVATGGVCGTDGIVTFVAGSATAAVTATPVVDAIPEGAETVRLTVVDGAGYDAGSPVFAEGSIVDPNEIPTLGEWGALLLVLTLAAVGWRRLRHAGTSPRG